MPTTAGLTDQEVNRIVFLIKNHPSPEGNPYLRKRILLGTDKENSLLLRRVGAELGVFYQARHRSGLRYCLNFGIDVTGGLYDMAYRVSSVLNSEGIQTSLKILER